MREQCFVTLLLLEEAEYDEDIEDALTEGIDKDGVDSLREWVVGGCGADDSRWADFWRYVLLPIIENARKRALRRKAEKSRRSYEH